MAHPEAGTQATDAQLIDLTDLIARYYELKPDPAEPTQRVAFGTSGHRGNSLKASFNEEHILAITQAVCEYRKSAGITGPLFIGRDTHALSDPAQMTAIRVCAANEVQVCIAGEDVFTPTPVLSFTILEYNKTHTEKADGIVITPSHNPPTDGGFKYNTPNGGPADTDVTAVIEQRANEILEHRLEAVHALSLETAMSGEYVQTYDFITPYVEALPQIVDIEAIKAAKLRIGVDPMGGTALPVYRKINKLLGLNLLLVNEKVDPRFAFMTLDHDGKIRMDCSSPYAMASMIKLRDKYDIAFGNDADADRHGIVTPHSGLMNPNHYLSVAIWYLFTHRRKKGVLSFIPFIEGKAWKDTDMGIGKTAVSSSMIDRIAKSLGAKLYEVPVGFKWFVGGLYGGDLAFGGEESAGASFLRMDSTPWSTDKDGIIMNLLAAEIRAVTGKDPGAIYEGFEAEFGQSFYARIDAVADPEQKAKLKAITPEDITADTLAGEPIVQRFSNAPGNDAALGGLKLVTENGWAAMRPSGTEDIYKIYAESFISETHLKRIQEEAQAILSDFFAR
ncbi:phosphoglucomutase (alpha-D-glucose-1,6-bisphosphate-dependent) [Sulfurimonas diazotrophicus]|uniref:Phosphoglucomutase (Alpha-D-glucose-1,6-bisphosphate-dependent) n=1 Tax=Sulfurimonas diazotrophicus TaxID=3131939 RepID=A0ABZ3H9E6_9BACT